MITYNDIYEAARKERYSEQLQPVPKNFIKEIADYLREKKEVAIKGNGDFSDSAVKMKKQLENAVTLFRELIIRRRKKILGLVLIASETGISKQDFENMFQIEKELFEEIMKCVENSDKKLNGQINGNLQEKSFENSLVLFIEELESFVGLTGEKMGPYDKGQIVNIPKEIAKILVDNNKAEFIEK
jgi:DNA replication initiation complex subunit (GINS family)